MADEGRGRVQNPGSLVDVIHGRSPALLPSSLSFFPYARVTFQVSWDCLPACLFRPPAPISLSLLHPPRARPPGPFQSISNLKFYETKLKLTSHLEAAGAGHGMGTQRPSASPHSRSFLPFSFLSPSLIQSSLSNICMQGSECWKLLQLIR